MTWLQRIWTAPLLYAGMTLVLVYFIGAVLRSIYERRQR
jgi:hypothetical protein